MPEPILTVTLKIPAGPYKIGDYIPVTVEIRNISDKAVWMVGVLDGSEDGTRYPHYSPAIEGPGLSPQTFQSEDNLLSPLRLQDFRLLSPGEAFDPTRAENDAAYLPLLTFLNFRPATPGKFRFSLTLSTGSPTPSAWLGKFGQEREKQAVLGRLAQVPRLLVKSNSVEIEVK